MTGAQGDGGAARGKEPRSLNHCLETVGPPGNIIFHLFHKQEINVCVFELLYISGLFCSCSTYLTPIGKLMDSKLATERSLDGTIAKETELHTI